jgi:hypothetical protein
LRKETAEKEETESRSLNLRIYYVRQLFCESKPHPTVSIPGPISDEIIARRKVELVCTDWPMKLRTSATLSSLARWI